MRIFAFLLLLSLTLPAAAGGEWEIDWYTVDGGGTMESAGGEWELKGTLGQSDATAANELAGGGWLLTGGFWSLLAEFLDLIFSDRFEDD